LRRPLIIEDPGARLVLLAPAVQPRLYNPLVDPEMRPAAVALGSRMVFDGWWDLRPDLPAFEALKELRRYGLLAVESEWEFSQGRLDDRPDFRDVTLGCLSPRDKLLLTRLQGAEIFTDGTLAGSWRTTQRMIRAAASGSMAVSLTSKEPVIPGIALWTPHTHSPAEAVV